MAIEMERVERQREFRRVLNQKPTAGMVLRSRDGSPVPVVVQHKPSRGCRADTRVFVCGAIVDGELLTWVLTPTMRGGEPIGLKCLILPRSQEELIRRHRGQTDNITVDALVVVRHNDRGTALICELE